MAENLREVFNQIAPGWYNFRHRTIFPDELEALAEEWKNGRLLNLGCGHGADFIPFSHDFELYGVDFSEQMVALAQRYAAKYAFMVNLAEADVCHLPYKNESFDRAIAVATYHHLKNEQRIVAFQELRRVLKPGGTAFITVWNHWQPRFWFGKGEVMVPWRIGEKIIYRYYNLFSYSSLVKLAKESDFEVIRVFPENRYRFPIHYFSRNICLLVRKSK
jgi:tRNA (uracil-5-)-methyltransferase TRM9